MKIVVTDSNLLPLRDEFEAQLPRGTETVWLPDDLLDVLRTADVLVGPAFTREMAEIAPALRLVQVAGAGTDRVEAAGVPVANTYHHEDSIAEYIVWALIALRRELPAADAALRRDRWRSPVYDSSIEQPQSLASATVGFLGFGHIGQAAWRVLQAFGAQGIAVTASGRAAADGLNWSGPTSRLGELLDEADALVVSAPLTDDTRGIVGAAELERLGPEGVLVNVARGPLVQQQALYDALRAKTIRGAALDVWYSYPEAGDQGSPADVPFRELGNVLLTPHLSGITRQTFRGRVQDIVANINALADGKELRNLVEL